jgi:hypothetical protein
MYKVRRHPYRALSFGLAVFGLLLLLFVAWWLGLLLILIAMVIDRTIWICAFCGNRVEQTSLLCPACGEELH